MLINIFSYYYKMLLLAKIQLQDTHDRLRVNLKLMDKLGFHFGAKIVRGAYMTQERQRAADMGYDDPIHNSYEDTNAMYDEVIHTVLRKVNHTPAEVMVASHNEQSVKLVVERYVCENCLQLDYIYFILFLTP